ncbi:UDP-N-acetylmuramoyl-L-alanine--D-glutamate ligase [Sphingomonas sp.]|uniref:UDP-N-acetylmuramoyl-L-alanine--D-glutamate ligase n=1 Tax=Sphingomonas sp. TaxID=28214 RepID=UPI003B000E19
MIVGRAWAGKRYAVLGLARSGAATVRALLAAGASVTAWDSDEARRDQFLPGTGRGTARSMVEGAAQPLPPSAAPLHQPAAGPPPLAGEDLVLADPLAIDLAGFDAIVVSPGVPLNRHPIAARAAEAGVPVIGDIELFAQARAGLPAHTVVGITGTNGKSTVTALVDHILQAAGVPTMMGGNIGLPILAQEPLPRGGVYVLELSSFQIDLTRSLDCDVAVLTNVTPDHLDRYNGFDAYAASKARLFAMQGPGDVAVIAIDDERTRALAEQLAAPPQPALAMGGFLGVDLPMPLPASGPTVVTVSAAHVADQSRWPSLQGPHNAQNVAVARAILRALGLDDSEIERGLAGYPGLPHRMERAGTVGGVLFVNDSKATNPTSAAPALAAYPRVHWILGGRRKTDELDACAPHYGHVAHAYTIGEATDLYADLVERVSIPATRSQTLDAAVAAAHAAAKPGETVLFSPACASFDQFSDYEARGDAFKQLVSDLGGKP